MQLELGNTTGVVVAPMRITCEPCKQKLVDNLGVQYRQNTGGVRARERPSLPLPVVHMGSKVRLLTSKVTPRWKKQLVGARRLEGRKAENDHAVITELMRNSRVDRISVVTTQAQILEAFLGAENGASGSRTDAVGGRRSRSLLAGL